MSEPVRTIKKYPNRRLYDTANSGYITLADVKQMVLEQIDFQVVDAKTGDDLTRAILLQIILDEEARRHADVQLRHAGADDPLLRQRAADDHGPVPGAERQGVHGDPEEAAGPGEAGLRRQDDADARPVEAVHADAGARRCRACSATTSSRARKLFMDMQQQMQDQTRGMFAAFPFPNFARRRSRADEDKKR